MTTTFVRSLTQWSITGSSPRFAKSGVWSTLRSYDFFLFVKRRPLSSSSVPCESFPSYSTYNPLNQSTALDLQKLKASGWLLVFNITQLAYMFSSPIFERFKEHSSTLKPNLGHAAFTHFRAFQPSASKGVGWISPHLTFPTMLS